MNIESLRLFCLSLKATTEGFPFDGNTLVFKVMGKMFALISLENPVSVNLKCDPERAIQLRETHPDDIHPGFHMNKKHWNTVSIIGGLPDQLIEELIRHSYQSVVKGLKKADRELLASMD